MSDSVENKNKNYAKEIEFIESKIRKSEKELELTDPAHSTRKRRQELNNNITLGRARLKAIREELEEEKLKEKKEIDLLGDSFKKLDMIPRTPLKVHSEEHTSPDVIPIQEPQDLGKTTSDVPTTSASIGITSTPSVCSTTTLTSNTDTITSLSRVQNTGAIPKTIFGETLHVDNVGTPAYVPLYSNEGNQIKINHPIKPPKLTQFAEKPLSLMKLEENHFLNFLPN